MPSEPIFVIADASAELEAMLDHYQAQTGIPVAPASPDRMILNTCAYYLTLARADANAAAVQNLVSFSNAPILDYLGELVRVNRLPASAALCILTFTLGPHSGVTIPAGTRVQSLDGKAIFATINAFNVTAGVTTANVPSQCTITGTIGNGYTASDVSIILDPQPYIVSAENTGDDTGGGADQETDDAYRDRIKLGTAQFTTAGPKASYIYHAKSANPSIIDVAVNSPTPGTVEIFPLMDVGGVTPAPVLAQVYAACNADDIRPLTDTVIVTAPTAIAYDVYVKVTTYADADNSEVLISVQAALEAYTLAKRQRLGQDVVLTQLIAVCQQDGVYEVAIYSDNAGTPTPFVDIVVDENEFGEVGIKNVSIIGSTVG